MATRPNLHTATQQSEKSSCCIHSTIASMVSVQMIQVSQQTELARRNAQRLSGTLTVFATLLWIGLLFVALRVVKPITQLTEQVQRVKRGEMVQITERGISSEISELYENFNEMVTSNDSRTKEIEHNDWQPLEKCWLKSPMRSEIHSMR